MKECFPHEKIKVIAESTKKQLWEIEHFKQSGEMTQQEAEEYTKIILDVLFLQREGFCA